MTRSAKKLVYALSLLGTSFLAEAYSIGITNSTRKVIRTKIIYAGGDLFCPSVERELSSGASIQLESGACCTSYIEMKDASGKVYYYYPPVTGFGISCRGYAFKIEQAADGTLIGTPL